MAVTRAINTEYNSKPASLFYTETRYDELVNIKDIPPGEYVCIKKYSPGVDSGLTMVHLVDIELLKLAKVFGTVMLPIYPVCLKGNAEGIGGNLDEHRKIVAVSEVPSGIGMGDIIVWGIMASMEKRIYKNIIRAESIWDEDIIDKMPETIRMLASNKTETSLNYAVIDIDTSMQKFSEKKRRALSLISTGEIYSVGGTEICDKINSCNIILESDIAYNGEALVRRDCEGKVKYLQNIKLRPDNDGMKPRVKLSDIKCIWNSEFKGLEIDLRHPDGRGLYRVINSKFKDCDILGDITIATNTIFENCRLVKPKFGEFLSVDSEVIIDSERRQ